MKNRQFLVRGAAIFGAVAALLAADFGMFLLPETVQSEAYARVGRPLTPLSYAGVARRTTRRVVRRSTIYINTLPAGCVSVNVNGAVYRQCGGAYYQPYGGRYVVVYID
jgi:hypothetical protein